MDFCSACAVGESHRLPSTLAKFVFTSRLELIYSDLRRPSHGFHYYITFVNASFVSLEFIS